MREILFRGKRIEDGQWVEGHYHFANWYLPPSMEIVDRTHYILQIGHGDADNIDPETVGQFTGLTDKNGKKIFEGDICRFREWNKGEMCWIGKVHFEHQQFMISGVPNKECETMFELCMSRFIPENIEVIGNIHDNPELLENP